MTTSEKDFPTMAIQSLPLKKIKDDINTEMLKYGNILDNIELFKDQ